MVEYLDKVIELREQRKSYEEIGEVLGFSRAWVGQLIKDHRPDLAGREVSEERPELEGRVVKQPDELLGLKISTKASRVGAVRSGSARLKPKNEGVNLSRRRRSLVKRLWGENKIPGSKFPEWLVENVLPELETEHQRKVFSNFYLLPIDEALAGKAKNDPDKTFRSYILTDLLPPIIKPFNVKWLLEEGVIKYGRKQRTSHSQGNGSSGSDSVGS